MKLTRERWGSRLGVILAVAGSAVGLGNFLRFPVQAAANGGGAFLIPYFIALLLLGIPLMLIEWTLGRLGGLHGYGTAPSIFAVATRNHSMKYFGVIGIFGPTIIFIWYTYVESWLLGFAFYALTGKLMEVAADGSTMRAFLQGYQGLVQSDHSFLMTYFFFLITFLMNIGVVYYGIKRGIEAFAKITMPIMFILGIIMLVRVVTLGAPNLSFPDWNISNGFGFLWNPDFSSLMDVSVWMAAAGQVFFTLSVGIGMILTYASYLSRDDDVVLSGLTSVSINEFTEVILAGSIVIPAAFVFMGPMGMDEVVRGGAFDLGFVSMSQIFAHINGGWFFAFMWFFMLFIAGITSSVSLLTPAISFMDDEFGIGRKKAVMITAALCFLACNGVIFGMQYGILDDLDFWSSVFCMVVLATIEAIIFGWVVGIEEAWIEVHHGADVRLPKFFKFIIKYVTPGFLIVLLGTWMFQRGIPVLMMEDIPPENKPFILAGRIFLVAFLAVLIILVRKAWKGRPIPELKEEVG